MAVGSVSAVSGNCNASYPKYLENKKKQGITLAIMGSGTLCTSSLIKNNKLGIGVAIVGLVGSLTGLWGAYNADKKLKSFNNNQNQATPNVDKLCRKELTNESQHALNTLAMMTPGGSAWYGKGVNFNKIV